jgi:hypothetical protein
LNVAKDLSARKHGLGAERLRVWSLRTITRVVRDRSGG